MLLLVVVVTSANECSMCVWVCLSIVMSFRKLGVPGRARTCYTLHHPPARPAMNDVHRLDTHLPEAYLIPGFITASEEAYLLTKVEECGGMPVDDDADSVDGTSTDSPRRFRGKAAGWKEVKGRRLMYWGGSVHPKGNTLIPLPLPAFMDRACRHK